MGKKKIPVVETQKFLDVEMESVGNHCIWPKKHNPRVWVFFDMDYFWTLKIDFRDFRKMWEITAYGQKTHNPCVWGFWYIDYFWTLKIDFCDFRKMWEITAYCQQCGQFFNFECCLSCSKHTSYVAETSQN